MLNAKLAAQNERTVQNLKRGFFISLLATLALRLLFRTLLPSKTVIAIFIITFVPELVLYRYLINIGTAKRDPTTGALLSAGEDLDRPGVIEWSFDVLYITCAFRIGLFC